MLIKKSKIRRSTIILAIALIGYLKPPFTVAYPLLDNVFDIARILSSAIVFWYIFSKRIKLSPVAKSILVYEALFVIITIARNGNTTQAIISGVTIVGEVFLFELGIKWNIRGFLKTLCNILIFYIFANFATVILVPNGFIQTEMGTPMYFLGIHNRFVFWMLPFFCYKCIQDYLDSDKIHINTYFIISLCLLTLLIKNAAGGVIGLTVALALTLLFQNRDMKVNDYRIFLATYFVLWLGLTFFDTIGNWEWLTYGIFHKSNSLLARLSLWQRGKTYLSEDLSHLLFGFGLESDAIIKGKFWYTHLHNNLLNVLYQSGIIGGLIYILPFIFVAKNLTKYKNSKICNVISLTLFSFLIMLLMDTYDLYGHLYTILILAANIDCFISPNRLKNITHAVTNKGLRKSNGRK